MKRAIRIGLADDHQLVTDSLSDFLTRKINCKIVYVARNGRELINKFNREEVDIILLDINMPEKDGLEALKYIKTKKPDQKVIALTMYDDDDLLLKLIKLKANAYLSKCGHADEVTKAINEVMETGFYLKDRMIEVMYQKTAGIPMDTLDQISYSKLDEVETDILRMLCHEYTSLEIAEQMHLSVRTVEGRRKKMVKALGVKNIAGLIMYAVKNGVVKV